MVEGEEPQAGIEHTAEFDAVPAFVFRTTSWLFPDKSRYDLDVRWSMISAFIAVQILLSYLAVMPVYAWMLPEVMPEMPALLPLLLVSVQLARLRRESASVLLTTFTLYALYMVTIRASGGATSPAISLLVTVPCVPLSLRADRSAMMWAGIVAVTGMLLGVEPVAGWMRVDAAPGVDAMWLLPWFLLIATLITMFSVLQVGASSLRLTDELREAVLDLRRTTRAAQAANDAKTVFLASMSHEIRTPMNGVLGTARLLARTELSEEQREYVRTLDESASALLGILDDILDMSRIEAGVVQLRSSVFCPADVVRCVTQMLSVSAREKGIALDVELNDVPDQVRGDPSRLRQVLVNLVGNAVKYTDAGRVLVGVSSAGRVGPGRLRLRWEVCDTGPGIPPELLGHVFERFTRGTDGTTARAAGAGLGLSIVRGIVHAMGGDVAVRSEVGAGSVFTFEIVLDEVEEVQAAPAPSMPARSFPVRALVVEDNPVNRLVARAMLEKLGCQVEVAEDGRLGCQVAMQRRFDIVFMDCAMPVMDGYEATRALRSSMGATAMCVPIVAMTADVMPSTREACLRAGMTAFVAKPTTLEVLDAMIAELCDDRARSGGVGPVPAPNGAEDQPAWAAGML